MSDYRILVADDEESIVVLLSGILKKEGYHVETAGDGQEAMDKLKNSRFDLVISDLKMPRADGLTLVDFIKQAYPETLVVLLTAHGTIDIAVEAMKKGAWDFLTKPLESPDQLRVLVNKARSRQQLVKENSVNKKTGCPNTKENLVYQDPKMQEIINLIKLVAPTDSTVLITGESGTGKEMAATQIHRLSQRADQPFIAVNCSALAENLLESELFGYEKGAFTGASAKKVGFFEMAHTGTLFLDEIGEISPVVQVKLLRVLQERSFTRVGGTSLVSVDVRVIAATNKDLAAAVATQSFREDLYYRLNVFPVHIPPLRERREDILILAAHFINKYAGKMNKSIEGMSPEAEQRLRDYDWPGNARELSNLIERAVILCPAEERIIPLHLGIPSGTGLEANMAGEQKDVLRNIEREAISKALNLYNGNRKMTAEHLGISLRSLYYKLKEYNIE